MYLIYLDESIDNKNQVIALGAVLISDRKCRKFCIDIERFIKKDLQLAKDVEIHADHIWNGRGEFLGFTMERRAELTTKIASYLGQSNTARFFYTQIYLNGKNRNEAYLELLDRIVNRGAKYVSKNAGRTNRQLMLIFDQRQDIKESILESLLGQHKRIINEYKSSCFFLDCGYEGLTKYSRLLQSADFIAYWGRQIKVLQKQTSLFKSADDSRKIKLIRQIENFWKNKFADIKK